MERKRSSRHRQRYRKRKSTCDQIKDLVREFIAFMFSNVGIIGLVVGYTICGAFMFMYIENGYEDFNKKVGITINFKGGNKVKILMMCISLLICFT
jgi:hypothetical protein